MVIDYQNAHLVAHHAFAPASRVGYTVLDPGSLADAAMAARTRAVGRDTDDLTTVLVFRGLPSNHHNPNGYAAVLREARAWERDPRVTVHLRALSYRSGIPQEKGIDVLVACHILDIAHSGSHDVVVAFTQDSDVLPAIEMARDRGSRGGVTVEVAGWGCLPVLRPRGASVRATRLGRDDFARARFRPKIG
jgi:hypothetical protein